MPTGRYIVALGAMLAGVAVVTGAFGAHILKPRLSEHMMEVFETGVLYHMFHSLALIFSGSLYLLALSEIRWLGAVTPLGGLCFITGWVCLAVGFLRHP